MALYHTQFEAKVFNASEPVLNTMGFSIVRLRQKAEKGADIQIMIERNDGEAVSLSDCEAVVKALQVILRVEEVIDLKQTIEISSAGIDRPLTRLQDFVRYQGSGAMVHFSLYSKVEGSKKFDASIVSVTDDIIKVHRAFDQCVVDLEFSSIKDANLVMTL